jgi:uncharacterized membrane protein YbaN (DUF454 family)
MRIRELTRILFLVCGVLSVGLAILGMFLPLLPTTPFLLLSVFFFGRSSERCHHLLLNNRWCGEYIRNYHEGRGMLLRQKIMAIAVLWTSIGYGVWFLGSPLPRFVLLAVAVGVTIYLLRLNTYRPEHQSV